MLEHIGKTIIARMRKVTSDAFSEGMLDENGDILSLNSVEKALGSIDIDLRDLGTGQFRDLQDVLDELGKKWEGLDSISKAYIATQLSGSRQQSRFIAVMDNYDKVIEAVELSQNSAGESLDQYQRHLQSAETALKQLRAAYEKFLSGLLNSKVIVVFARTLATLFNYDFGGLITSWTKVILAALAVYVAKLRISTRAQMEDNIQQAIRNRALEAGIVRVQDITDSIRRQGEAEARLNAIRTGQITPMQDLITYGDRLNANREQSLTWSQLMASASQRTTEAYTNLRTRVASLNIMENIRNGTLMAGTAATIQHTASTWAANIALGAWNILLGIANTLMGMFSVQMLITVGAFGVLGIALGVISKVLGYAIKKIYGWIEGLSAAKRAAKEYAKQQKELEDKDKEIDGLEKLVERYNELSNTINKTAEETKEYIDIVEQLEAKDLISPILGEANAYALKAKKVRETLDALKEERDIIAEAENDAKIEKLKSEGARTGGETKEDRELANALAQRAQREMETIINKTNSSRGTKMLESIILSNVRNNPLYQTDATEERMNMYAYNVLGDEKYNITDTDSYIKNKIMSKFKKGLKGDLTGRLTQVEQSVTTLINDYNPENLAKAKEDYNQAVEALKKLDSDLAIGGVLGSDFADYLENMSPDIVDYDNAIKNVLANVESLSETGQLLKEAIAQIEENGQTDSETLQKIIETYPTLRDEIAETGDLSFEQGNKLKKMYESLSDIRLIKLRKEKDDIQHNLDQVEQLVRTQQKKLYENQNNQALLGVKTPAEPGDKTRLEQQEKVLSNELRMSQKRLSGLRLDLKNINVMLGLTKTTVKDINLEYESAKKAVEESTKKYEESYKIIEDIKEAGGLTPDSAENVMNNFPELIQYMDNAELLMEKLQSSRSDYENDAKNAYQNMMVEKIKTDSNYNDEYLSSLENMLLLSQMKATGIRGDILDDAYEQYKNDLENFKTIEEAKLNFATLMSSQYQNILAKNAMQLNGMDFSKAAEDLRQQSYDPQEGFTAEDYINSINEINKQKKLLDLIDDSVKKSAEDFKLVMPKKSSKKGSTTEIDYLEAYLDLLESEIELLQSKRRDIDKANDEYRKSLHTENNLQREKLKLLTEEYNKSLSLVKNVSNYKSIINQMNRLVATGQTADVALNKVSYGGNGMKDYEEAFKKVVNLKGQIRQTAVDIANVGGEWWKSLTEAHDNVIENLEQQANISSSLSDGLGNQTIELDKQLKIEIKRRKELEKKMDILNDMVLANNEIVNTGGVPLFSNEDLHETKNTIEEIKAQLNDISQIREMAAQSVENLTNPYQKDIDNYGFDVEVLGNGDAKNYSSLITAQQKALGAQKGKINKLFEEAIKANTLMGSDSIDYIYYLEQSKEINTKLKEEIKEYYSIKNELEDKKIESIEKMVEGFKSADAPVDGFLSMIEKLSNINNLDGASKSMLNKKNLEAINVKLKGLKEQFDILSSVEATSHKEAVALADSLNEIADSINDAEVKRIELMANGAANGMQNLQEEIDRVNSSIETQIKLTKTNIDLIEDGYRDTDELLFDFESLNGEFSIVDKQKNDSEKIIADYEDRYNQIQKLREKDFEKELELYDNYEILNRQTAELYEKELLAFITKTYETNSIAEQHIQVLSDIVYNGHKEITEGIASSWENLNNKLQQFYIDSMKLAGKLGKEVQSVLISDPNGNMSVGYLENNKTYDIHGNRPQMGSVVQTPDGNFWEMGGGQVSGFNQRQSTPNLAFSGRAYEKPTYDKEFFNYKNDDLDLSFGSEEEEDSFTLAINSVMSEDLLKRIKEYKKDREKMDDTIKRLQETVDINSDTEVENLLSKIRDTQEKDVQFQLEIQKELLNNQKKALKEYKEKMEQNYHDSIIEGDSQTILANLEKYKEAQLKYAEVIENLDNITEEYYNSQFKLLQDEQDLLSKKIVVMKHEENMTKKITKEYKINIKIMKDSLAEQEKMRNLLLKQKEELKQQRDLLAVGGKEWNILNDKIEDYESSIRKTNEEMVDGLQAIQKMIVQQQVELIEKNILLGKTLEEVREEKEEYIDGLEKEHTIEKLKNEINREGLALSGEQLAVLEQKGKIKREDLERLEKEVELQKLQLKLDNLRNQKTKRELTFEDGRYQYKYVADQDAINEAEDALVEAQIDKDKWEDEVYLDNIEKLLENIEETMSKALEGGTYSSIDKFTTELRNIAAGFNISDYIDTLTVNFTTYLDKLSDLSTLSPVAETHEYNISKIEFPNIKDAKEIENSLKTLKQRVKQKMR